MEALNMPVKVAVYGTLRNGFGNHGLISGSPLLGNGFTKERFLLSASGIPFVTKISEHKEPELYEDTAKVKVEVYSVETQEDLNNLDALEGHPRWYRREETVIEMENGEEVTAWLYFYDQPASTIIKTGDYADYRRSFSY